MELWSGLRLPDDAPPPPPVGGANAIMAPLVAAPPSPPRRGGLSLVAAVPPPPIVGGGTFSLPPVVLRVLPLRGSPAPVGFIYDETPNPVDGGLLAAASAFFSHQGHQVYHDPCPDLAEYDIAAPRAYRWRRWSLSTVSPTIYSPRVWNLWLVSVPCRLPTTLLGAWLSWPRTSLLWPRALPRLAF